MLFFNLLVIYYIFLVSLVFTVAQDHNIYISRGSSVVVNYTEDKKISVHYINDNATSSVEISHIVPIANSSSVQLLGGYLAVSFEAYIGNSYSKIFPKHNVTLNFLDDASEISSASLHLIDSTSLNPKSSAGIVGAANSEVSVSLAGMTGSLSQFQLSCASTTPALSDKSLYPTFMRLLPDDKSAAAAIVQLAKLQFGWNRFVIVHTNDAYGIGQAEVFNRVAEGLGMTVVGLVNVPFNARANNKTSYPLLVRGFEMATEFQNSIFLLSALGDDARYILSVAAEKKVLGYQNAWLGGEWPINNLLDGWDFANENPQLFEGLLSVRMDCYTDSPDYFALVKQTNYTMDASEQNTFTCAGYDSAHVYTEALNKTFTRMELEGINTDCIERVYFLNNKETCNLSTLEQELYTKSNCATNCTVCGVCEMIKFFEQNDNPAYFLHIWQAYMLYEAHQVSFVGATGPVSFDKNGDRNMETAQYAILNSQYNRTTKSFKFVQMKRVNANGDTVMNTTTEVFRFAPKSIDEVNFVQPSDMKPYTVRSLAIWVGIVWSALVCIASVVFLVAVYLFLKNRHQLVIKTASIPLMLTIAGGGFISFMAVIVLVWEGSTQAGCIAFTWLRAMGFIISFGSLFLKTYRVKKVFSGTLMKDNSLNNVFLFSILGVMMFGWCVFLSVWTLVEYDSFLTVVCDPNDRISIHYICYKPNIFQWVLFGGELVLLFLGSILAYNVHHAPSFFNEARLIAFCIYNWFLIAILVQMVTALVTDLAPELYYCLLSLAIFTQYSVTIGALYFHKLHICYIGRGNEQEKTKFGNQVFPRRGNHKGLEAVPLSQLNSNSGSLNAVGQVNVPKSAQGRNVVDLDTGVLTGVSRDFNNIHP